MRRAAVARSEKAVDLALQPLDLVEEPGEVGLRQGRSDHVLGEKPGHLCELQSSVLKRLPDSSPRRVEERLAQEGRDRDDGPAEPLAGFGPGETPGLDRHADGVREVDSPLPSRDFPGLAHSTGRLYVRTLLDVLVSIPRSPLPRQMNHSRGLKPGASLAPGSQKTGLADCQGPDKRGRKDTMRRKITVVGAGNVGATAAQRLAEKEMGDVVLVDIIEGVPQGKALDMYQSGPVEGFDGKVVGSNGYEETAGSDMVILTAGLARKPGMSRDDLLKKNEEIVAACTAGIMKYSKNPYIVVVTNPLDAMCEVARRVSKLPKNRVVGMAGILDTARMRAFISMETGYAMSNIHATVLGGHGDTMVPLPRYSTIAGVPITELLPPEKVAAIVKRTAGGGGEIVALLKTGSAYYAPSAAAVEMADAIFNDKKKILPCAAYLEGEYGIKGLYVGVPAVLGHGGVEKIIELKLTAEEAAALKKSSDSVAELFGLLTC